MMRVQIVTGSKSEIAEQLVRIPGEVRQAYVVIEDTNPSPFPESAEDLFKEMDEYMVDVGSADYSREAIYSRMEGE